MKLLYKLIEWQVFVAICVTGLAFFFEILLNTFYPSLLVIIGIGTFVLYNFSTRNLRTIQPEIKWLLFGLLSLIVLIALFNLKPITILTLGGLFILTLLYKIPLFGIRFREIPFLKLFQIALVWSSLIVIVPILEAGTLEVSLYLWLACFLFIIGITLPFDYNDIQTDKNKLKTIPMLIGVHLTKILCTVLLLASAVIFCFEVPELSYRLSWIITISIAIILCLNISHTKSRFYYRFWIESISLIPIIVFAIFFLLN